ncbi:sterol desaturase family protein [Rhodoblastus sp.]|uniref:sterol desaturase family protein n=1 Tax=Rhodoblastus sp. TaxID=1962975 RepID=UPI003F9B2E97
MALAFLRHGSNGALIALLAALAFWPMLGGPALGMFWIGMFWIVLGAVLFHASEYVWRRFAFHAPPAPGPSALRLQRRLHFDHHAEPNRLDLLFLPIWFLAALLAASAALFWLVFGAYAVASLVFGVGLAILHYEWTHYVAHIPYQPHTAWGRYIKRYHLRHHFISEKSWFGVSNPTFDYLYGTRPAPKTVAKSPFVRNLFGDRAADRLQ